MTHEELVTAWTVLHPHLSLSAHHSVPNITCVDTQGVARSIDGAATDIRQLLQACRMVLTHVESTRQLQVSVQPLIDALDAYEHAHVE